MIATKSKTETGCKRLRDGVWLFRVFVLVAAGMMLTLLPGGQLTSNHSVITWFRSVHGDLVLSEPWVISACL